MPLYRINGVHVMFIHVPKTGGTSISDELRRIGEERLSTQLQASKGTLTPNHLIGKDLETLYFPEAIDYSFMIVRHPIARLVSEYRYQRRHFGIHLSRFRSFGFHWWLKYALYRYKQNPYWRGNHFKPQHEFECFGARAFRIEDGLAQIMTALAEVTKLQLDPQVRQLNKSPARDVHISSNDVDRIASLYREDFDRYGYEVSVPAMENVTYAG